ncbi:hypothetical protein DMA11_08770 [Marinilabiliaceae bacterium JC017]|nr:hypothetical protein DMA11_08770 [Marinilabiliaceae bacterium JC017]
MKDLKVARDLIMKYRSEELRPGDVIPITFLADFDNKLKLRANYHNLLPAIDKMVELGLLKKHPNSNHLYVVTEAFFTHKY